MLAGIPVLIVLLALASPLASNAAARNAPTHDAPEAEHVGAEAYSQVRIRIGAVVAAPPRGHARVSVGRTRYHYHGGVFYRPYARGYRVVAAPVGARVRRLPAAHTVVRTGRGQYYYARGAFYQWHRPSRLYVVVRGPVGATVRHLPAGYATVRIGGAVHYRIGGAVYRPVVRRGVTVYTVVRA